MFESYQEIFDTRGDRYHQAMINFPDARSEEFRYVIKLADLEDGQVIYDIPSGGGYLASFIPYSVKLLPLETAKGFIQSAQQEIRQTPIYCDDVCHVPLPDFLADRVISLAGSHHLPDAKGFYQEVYRLLKPRGIFCLADVALNSGVAQFLNVFVDQHSSMGHKGIFLNSTTRFELEAVGFQIQYDASIKYSWRFNTVEEMLKFCVLLFGIDQASPAQILQGIEEYLGYQLTTSGCLLSWELHFLKCLKADESQ